MTSTTEKNGRLGNQIIRNLAVSLIAKKYDMKVSYSSNSLIHNLGIKLFSGKNVYDRTEILNEDNYFSTYNCDELTHNLDPNNSYFQTKEITNFLYDYLNTDEVRTNIINNNPFKNLYKRNNNLFIHIRLDDVARFNPGINYYLNAIKNISFDRIYISTDEQSHDIIKKIMELYPNSELIRRSEIETFQFASTCKHVLLSHGSFSAVIGYLSFFSDVYYPEYEVNKIWYGDMFSINSWIKCSVH
jgi:hypothetical protein